MSKRNFKKKQEQKTAGKEKFKENYEVDTKRGGCDMSPNGRKPGNMQATKPNDWRWYAQNEQMLKDAASFSYFNPIGNEIDWGYATDLPGHGVPGIMAIRTAPTFGWNDGPTTPLNIASTNLYSFVRYANSGAKNYDAPDLMMYLLTMDSIFSYHAFLKRIYGMAQLYSNTNWYYPKGAVYANGVDFEDVIHHLADLRYYINNFAVRAGSYCIPATMSYMAKHMWMYSGIYLDTPDNDKAQTYMFVPAGFYKFSNAESADYYSSLQYVPFLDEGLSRPNTPSQFSQYTVAQLQQYGDNLLAGVHLIEDVGIMSGDILKAFGPNMVYHLDGISEAYTVFPAYIEEVCDQIENMTLVGEFTTPANYNLLYESKANPGYLTYTPRFSQPTASEAVDYYGGRDPWMCNRVVTFLHGNVDPKDTMEATRMTNIATGYLEADHSFTIDTISSEVALSASIVCYNANSSGAYVPAIYGPLYVGNSLVWNLTAGQSYPEQLEALSEQLEALNWERDMLASFDRHPQVMWNGVFKYTPTSGNPTYVNAVTQFVDTDINYFTTVNPTDLKKMASCALISMFNIDQYGKSQGK